jgi:hypothetical protein
MALATPQTSTSTTDNPETRTKVYAERHNKSVGKDAARKKTSSQSLHLSLAPSTGLPYLSGSRNLKEDRQTHQNLK